MGCRSSKPEETPPVALCRERQELICAAADHRYALAAAHTAYFRALGRVGDALLRFVQEELTPPPDSPVLTLPPSEGKGKGKGKEKGKGKGKGKGKEKAEIEESESNVDRIDVASSISLSNSDDSHLHFHSDVDDEEIHEEDGGFRAGSGVGDGQGGGGGGGEKGGGGEGGGGGAEGGGGEGGGGGGGGGDSWYYPPYPPHLSYPSYPSYDSYPSFGNVGIPNYYYMKKNATKPTTVYQEPYGGISKPGYMAYGYGYDNPMYGFPMDSGNNPVQDQGFYQIQAMVSPQKEVKDDSPPPPPPPPEGSSWDFFNPFDSYEQMFPGYGQGGYGVASVASSPNSSEVREREGIPDLEEETEQESVKEAVKEKKVVESSSEVNDAGIGVGSSEATAGRKEAETDHVVVSETASQGTFKGSKVRSSEKKADVKVKQVSFEEDKSLVTDDSGPSKGSALFACGTRDVEEVVKEIKEQFNSAASCGEEVSKMLEVGRMRHRSRNKIVRFILSRIFDHIALPVSTSQLSELEKINDIEFSNLSSVLDRLCTWEKKLYKEVKDEEKLRLIYDREWKHLKALDDNGAEPSEIDAIRASIRTLLTRINIAVRSVNAISSRIHKLRDDELQPQLMKLIQGQIRMWKFVLDCHQKQFLAVVESRAHDLVPKTGMQRTAASKATMELELELLNWRSCFRDWIRTQRDYVKALNEWLLKWLLQEKEETPDGVAPFSPCRMGAPSVFVTSNDWCQATETLSESGVTDAMQAFSINVHMLWERQGEEQQQKQKADYLSKDFAKRLLYLQKENGMDGRFDLDKSVIPIKSNNDPFHDRMMALDALQKRLAEERAKHEETIKHVQEASAGNLRVGLMPIFEALGIFSSETLKGYEGIRMEKGSRVT